MNHLQVWFSRELLVAEPSMFEHMLGLQGAGAPSINSLSILGPEITEINHKCWISTPMARQKLSMSEIPIAGRDEAIGRGPGPWKRARTPKIAQRTQKIKLDNSILQLAGSTCYIYFR